MFGFDFTTTLLIIGGIVLVILALVKGFDKNSRVSSIILLVVGLLLSVIGLVKKQAKKAEKKANNLADNMSDDSNKLEEEIKDTTGQIKDKVQENIDISDKISDKINTGKEKIEKAKDIVNDPVEFEDKEELVDQAEDLGFTKKNSPPIEDMEANPGLKSAAPTSPEEYERVGEESLEEIKLKSATPNSAEKVNTEDDTVEMPVPEETSSDKDDTEESEDEESQ